MAQGTSYNLISPFGAAVSTISISNGATIAGGLTVDTISVTSLNVNDSAILNQRYNVSPQTANYTINTATLESNTLFTNSGAAGAVQFTLPSGANTGDAYTFSATAAQTVTILAQGSHRFQNIVGGITRTILTSAAQYNTVKVTYAALNTWIVLYNTGFTSN